MIAPRLAFIMMNALARATLNAPVRLVWITVDQSSSLIITSSLSRVRPALLTTASRRPNSALAALTIARTSLRSATSVLNAIALTPSAAISAFSFSACSSLLR